MLFELAGAFLGTALEEVQSDNNHQKQMERLAQEAALQKKAQQHETTMAIINCVNTLLEAANK